jgi:hypothetical protein
MATETETVAVEERSLASLLQLTREGLAAELDRKTLANAVKAQDKAVAAWMKKEATESVSLQIAEHVCAALQGSLVDVFASAWSKYYELRMCADETREDPKSSQLASLAEHEFNYETGIHVDVLVNGKTFASIPFALVLACEVTGLELVLKGGCVHEVRSGTLECRAELRCAAKVVWSRSLKNVELPGELKLKRPIAIGGA